MTGWTNEIASLSSRIVQYVKQAFDDHPDPLSLFPFRLFGHYKEAGYKLVADTVLESLEPASHLRGENQKTNMPRGKSGLFSRNRS